MAIAKIADFGVAKLNLANYTLAGRVLGTPAFMSPEQLNGDAVDGRSDLFSLGVILYTIVTGYRPFQGNSALTVSSKWSTASPYRRRCSIPICRWDSITSLREPWRKILHSAIRAEWKWRWIFRPCGKGEKHRAG